MKRDAIAVCSDDMAHGARPPAASSRCTRRSAPSARRRLRRRRCGLRARPGARPRCARVGSSWCTARAPRASWVQRYHRRLSALAPWAERTDSALECADRLTGLRAGRTVDDQAGRHQALQAALQPALVAAVVDLERAAERENIDARAAWRSASPRSPSSQGRRRPRPTTRYRRILHSRQPASPDPRLSSLPRPVVIPRPAQDRPADAPRANARQRTYPDDDHAPKRASPFAGSSREADERAALFALDCTALRRASATEAERDAQAPGRYIRERLRRWASSHYLFSSS